jgi:hypothetical protein
MTSQFFTSVYLTNFSIPRVLSAWGSLLNRLYSVTFLQSVQSLLCLSTRTDLLASIIRALGSAVAKASVPPPTPPLLIRPDAPIPSPFKRSEKTFICPLVKLIASPQCSPSWTVIICSDGPLKVALHHNYPATRSTYVDVRTI